MWQPTFPNRHQDASAPDNPEQETGTTKGQADHRMPKIERPKEGFGFCTPRDHSNRCDQASESIDGHHHRKPTRHLRYRLLQDGLSSVGSFIWIQSKYPTIGKTVSRSDSSSIFKQVARDPRIVVRLLRVSELQLLAVERGVIWRVTHSSPCVLYIENVSSYRNKNNATTVIAMPA